MKKKILETTIDISPSELKEQNEYIDKMNRGQDMMMYRLFHVYLHPDFIWKRTKMGQEYINIGKFTWNFIQKVINMKKQQKPQNNKRFLNYLLEKGENWTDREIMDETQTMIIAGSESTAVTESFALLLLALHPDIQERLHEELLNTYHGYGTDLNQLDHLERVLKETLRMFPTIPTVARHLTKDIQLDSHFLPAGSNVLIPLVYVHRRPEIWPDPWKFDPDRFLPEQIEKRPVYAFMPFSAGPRNCIGSKYAMMSMKCLLGNVIRNFKVFTEYKSVHELHQEFGITSKPKSGFKLKLVKRVPLN